MSDSAKHGIGRGCVHVYTGDGKGKTTAAVGLALRALGAGLRIYVGQFLKSEPSSEIQALARFGDQVECHQFGCGRWMRGKPSDEDIQLAREGLATAREAILSGEFQVVVLDEAAIAPFFHLIEVDDLLTLVDDKPDGVELVLTGRRADPRLIERADLVTEMREVKHYHRQGVPARKGIED